MSKNMSEALSVSKSQYNTNKVDPRQLRTWLYDEKQMI